MVEARRSTTGRTPWVVSFRTADPHKIPIDPNGNLASKTEGTDTWAYTWSAENDLSGVTKNGIEQAHFAYDPLNRRVEKIAGGVTTSYTYDGGNIVRERRAGVVRDYVHGLSVDEPLVAYEGSAATYFHADGLGSIVKMADAAGGVTLVRQYDAWGNLQTAADQQGHAFTGREWDAETGFYYYRARYYDPGSARFLSEDPIGDPDDFSLYAYVQNRPTNLTDPSGLQSQKPQICTGARFKNKGHVCCEGGKLVPCVPPGTGPHWECLVEHEQCHIDDLFAQGAAPIDGPQCKARRCQPLAGGDGDECMASRAQWDCLRRKGVSPADAAYVKTYARKKGCRGTQNWR